MRPGLIAKKIKRRSGGLATYWVKPGGDQALERLAAAKRSALQHTTPLPISPQPTPVAPSLHAGPLARRGPGVKLAPQVEPPPVLLLPKAFDTSSIQEAGVNPRTIGPFVRQNQQEFRRLGRELDAAFVNGKGTARVDAIPDPQMNFIMGPQVQGAYNPSTGDMALRNSVLIGMMTPLIAKGTPTAAQIGATQIWTHEQLHAASNQARPSGEPLSAPIAPHRWLEEATTELLAHHYNSQVVTALTGKLVPRVLPILVAHTKEGELVLETQTQVAYRNQSMRFVNTVAYLTGARAGDSPEDINRAVLGYAAGVKRLGLTRYEYLATDMLAAHGFEPNTPGFQEAHQDMTQSLQTFMGTPAPSTLYGSTPDSIEGTVQASLARTQARVPHLQPAATPVFHTPLAKPTPKAKAGRRAMLKVKL